MQSTEGLRNARHNEYNEYNEGGPIPKKYNFIRSYFFTVFYTLSCN